MGLLVDQLLRAELDVCNLLGFGLAQFCVSIERPDIITANTWLTLGEDLLWIAEIAVASL